MVLKKGSDSLNSNPRKPRNDSPTGQKVRELFTRFQKAALSALYSYVIETTESQVSKELEQLPQEEKAEAIKFLSSRFFQLIVEYFPELQLGRLSHGDMKFNVLRLASPDLKDLNDNVLSYVEANNFLDSLREDISKYIPDVKIVQCEGKHIYFITPNTPTTEEINTIQQSAENTLARLTGQENSSRRTHVAVSVQTLHLPSNPQAADLTIYKHRLTTQAKINELLAEVSETPYIQALAHIKQTYTDLNNYVENIGIQEVFFPKKAVPLLLDISITTILRKPDCTPATLSMLFAKQAILFPILNILTKEEIEILFDKGKTYIKSLNIPEATPPFSARKKEYYERKIKHLQETLKSKKVDFGKAIEHISTHYKDDGEMGISSPFGHLKRFIENSAKRPNQTYYQICFDIIGLGTANYQGLMKAASQVISSGEVYTDGELQKIFLNSITKINDQVFLTIQLLNIYLAEHAQVSIELSTGDEGEIILTGLPGEELPDISVIENILNNINNGTHSGRSITSKTPFRIRASISQATHPDIHELIRNTESNYEDTAQQILRLLFSKRLNLLTSIENHKAEPGAENINVI